MLIKSKTETSHDKKKNIKRRTFYRIETLNMERGGVPQSGYLGPLNAILCMRLGLRADYTAEELLDALNLASNPDMNYLMSLKMLLTDIPIPEIYEQNKGTDNYYCLYNKEEYKEAAEILKDELIQSEMSILLPEYAFRCKKFK